MNLDSLDDWQRSFYCGAPRAADIGQAVTVMGWVHGRRDHGGVVFVDLRDRTGLLQVVFDPQQSPAAHSAAGDIRSEYVIAVRGTIAARPAETLNPTLATGEIEVIAQQLRILNEAQTPPFVIDDDITATESTRLKYRYLDLRRPSVIGNLVFRHRITVAIREYLDQVGFVEVETPVLTRSTPEGARDYLVPSRVNPGSFYALPQSPQLFKQLLMVGVWIATFRSLSASAMKICGRTANPSSPRSTLKCPLFAPKTFSSCWKVCSHAYLRSKVWSCRRRSPA